MKRFWALLFLMVPVFGVLTFVMLRGTTPLFTYVDDISTPEEHLARARAQAQKEAAAGS